LKFIIDKEELSDIIKKMPIEKIAKQYGVTAPTVKKRCKKLNIEIPKFPIGYWLKKPH
jgi:DNA-binding MurR/RpiR family transcriptional regulator